MPETIHLAVAISHTNDAHQNKAEKHLSIAMSQIHWMPYRYIIIKSMIEFQICHPTYSADSYFANT